MNLEEQIKRLASLGIPLNDGVALDELLISNDREQYEAKPFKLLLSRMGGEVEAPPWGRRISDRVWYLDTECVHGTGAYIELAERMTIMARADERIEEIRDRVDFDEEEAWLRYVLDGEPRQIDAEIDDEWLDLEALRELAGDLESGGYRFAGAEDG